MHGALYTFNTKHAYEVVLVMHNHVLETLFKLYFLNKYHESSFKFKGVEPYINHSSVVGTYKSHVKLNLII